LAPDPSTVQEADLQRAPFRDLHGASLHGFTLLLTLGDRPLAASIAAGALAEGVRRVDELRHPERAAAFLRRQAVRTARRIPGAGALGRSVRMAALRELGTREPVIASLEGLSLEQRAAIVASAVEGFSPVDTAVILGRDLASTRRVVRTARRRYLAVAVHWMRQRPGDEAPSGAIAARVAQRARGILDPRSVEPVA
jgi:DNA-directed RNA polymerase specialized sigma24 family protein